MEARNTTTQYGAVAQILHWLIAALIVCQLVLATLAEAAEDADMPLRQLALLANHKSVGMTILVLACVRLAWRLCVPPPPLPDSVPRWQVSASQISHYGIYALIFLIPITGWLMSSASAYRMSWFNLFTIPDLLEPDPALKDRFKEIHEALAILLFALVLVHIAAALKHHFIDKDTVLKRMSSRFALILFIATTFGAIVTLSQTTDASGTVVDEAGTPAPGSAAPAPGDDDADNFSVGSAPPLWNIDYDQSYIRFIGEQAGANFDGEWRNWSASIRFDASDLAASLFDVSIDITSVDTGDQERDETIMSPEWFDAKRFAAARFSTEKISVSGENQFEARSVLCIKGKLSPVSFTFRVKHDGERRVLSGSSRLDRLALGLGSGEWEDTDWVGRHVDVRVRVVATLDAEDSG